MIALIGIILLIGIVKKNGIMMVDFAITAERRDGVTPLDAIRQACLLRFRPILMTTMAALLTGLPLMLGNGAGLRTAPAAGLRDGRRAAAEPGADALHDAGDLSVSRPAAAPAGAAARRRMPTLAEKMGARRTEGGGLGEGSKARALDPPQRAEAVAPLTPLLK